MRTKHIQIWDSIPRPLHSSCDRQWDYPVYWAATRETVGRFMGSLPPISHALQRLRLTVLLLYKSEISSPVDESLHRTCLHGWFPCHKSVLFILLDLCIGHSFKHAIRNAIFTSQSIITARPLLCVCVGTGWAIETGLVSWISRKNILLW